MGVKRGCVRGACGRSAACLYLADGLQALVVAQAPTWQMVCRHLWLRRSHTLMTLSTDRVKTWFSLSSRAMCDTLAVWPTSSPILQGGGGACVGEAGEEASSQRAGVMGWVGGRKGHTGSHGVTPSPSLSPLGHTTSFIGSTALQACPPSPTHTCTGCSLPQQHSTVQAPPPHTPTHPPPPTPAQGVPLPQQHITLQAAGRKEGVGPAPDEVMHRLGVVLACVDDLCVWGGACKGACVYDLMRGANVRVRGQFVYDLVRGGGRVLVCTFRTGQPHPSPPVGQTEVGFGVYRGGVTRPPLQGIQRWGHKVLDLCPSQFSQLVS